MRRTTLKEWNKATRPGDHFIVIPAEHVRAVGDSSASGEVLVRIPVDRIPSIIEAWSERVHWADQVAGPEQGPGDL